MLEVKKSKRVVMTYLEKHRQVKEVGTTDQLARKDRLGDCKLGFRLFLGITCAKRVMLKTT